MSKILVVDDEAIITMQLEERSEFDGLYHFRNGGFR